MATSTLGFHGDRCSCRNLVTFCLACRLDKPGNHFLCDKCDLVMCEECARPDQERTTLCQLSH